MGMGDVGLVLCGTLGGAVGGVQIGFVTASRSSVDQLAVRAAEGRFFSVWSRRGVG